MIAMRLSVMMFIQFFLWGAWYVMAYVFLGKIGFGGDEISWTYSVGSIAGMISPLFVGMFVDRFFSTERVLGVLHLLGGAFMFAAVAVMEGDLPDSLQGMWTNADTENPSAVGINLLFFGHMLCFFPTLSLTNTLALHNMTNAEKQFPLIRVFGTFGWIAAGFFISSQGWDGSIEMFRVAAVAAIVMGLYSFTLPHTPPPLAGKKVSIAQTLGFDALVLLKQPAYLVFMISSFLICIPLAFYYQLAGTFVDQAGVANPAFKMTFGQISEVVFMLVMPLFFARLGVKWMLFVGMLSWVVRYALFALGADDGVFWMVICGVTLHGICYDFFFVTGQIYTDRVAPSNIRGQAQGMLVLFTLGLGMFIGAQAAGWIEESFKPDNSKQLQEDAEEVAKEIEARQAEVDKITGITGQPWLVQQRRKVVPIELPPEEASRVDELQGEMAELREDRSKILLTSVHWKPIWAIPAVFAAAVMILFTLVFRDDSGDKEVTEGQVAEAAGREENP